MANGRNKSADGNTVYSFTGRIAGWSSRHRRAVLVGTLAVVAVALLLTSTIGVETSDTFGAGDAARAQRLVEDRFDIQEPADGLILFSNPNLDVDDPAFRSTVEPLVAELRGLEGVASVVTVYDTGLDSMVSDDRHVLMARLEFIHAEEEDLSDFVEPVMESVASANERAASDGFDIGIIGGTSSVKEYETIQSEDFSRILLIALVGGFIIMVLAFGAVVAALLPLVMALVAIFASVGVAALVSQVQPLNFYYYEMILLMGLAVGIDYSLFIVNRFREERAAGHSKVDAISAASHTTGRAVFYAGVAVVASLAGLLLTGDALFIGLGLGAMIVVLFAILGSLTLLPALLSALGDKVNWLRIPGLGRPASGGGIWGAISGVVLARPAISAGITVAALIALSVPLLWLHIGTTPINSDTVPAGFENKRALELLEENFTLGEIEPLYVVVDPGSDGNVNTPTIQDSVTKLIDRVGQDDAFIAPFDTQISEAGNLMLITVPIVNPASKTCLITGTPKR